MATVRDWIDAARPKTLTAAAAPVIMGTVLAADHGGVVWPAALAALVAALLIQVGTNLANDYFDARKGGDTHRRIGPTRITASGRAAPGAVRRAFIACFATAFALGIYLVARGGWPVVVIGLSSLAFGVLYTAGPAPLAWTGSADVFAFLYFGPVAVAGTTYVQTLTWPPGALWAGAAAGGFSLALLTVNNYRDRDEDAQTGKRTLAVRFGARFAHWEYRLALLLAVVAPVVMVVHHGERRGWLVPAALTLALLVPLQTALTGTATTDGAFGGRMNRLLAATGRLELLYAIAAAVAVWAW